MRRRALTAGLWVLVATVGAAGLATYWVRPPDLAVPPQGASRFGPVTVIEPGVGRRANVVLSVLHGRISSVEPARPGSDGSSGELSGTFVLPGLIDLHVHHPPVWFPGGRRLFALLFLAHGVTTVRDMGSYRGDALQIEARIAAGDYPGPRTLACGPVLDGPGAEWPGSIEIRAPDEAAAVVEALLERGARCAKLYNGLSSGATRALLAAAGKRGLRVAGHVPDGVSLRALPGFEVQHLMGAARAGEVLDSPRAQLVARLARTLRQQHTPTLVTFYHYAARAGVAPSPEGPGRSPLPRIYDPARLPLPSALTDIFWARAHNARLAGIAPESGADPASHLAWVERLTRVLLEAGVPVLAGSDTPNPGVAPGASLLEELGLLVRTGLSAEAAWQTATRRAAGALGEPLLGRLTPGAPADLLFFREDPTRDLAAVATLEAVMARGRLYQRGDLEDALGVYRRYVRGSFYRRLTTWMMRGALVAVGDPVSERSVRRASRGR